MDHAGNANNYKINMGLSWRDKKRKPDTIKENLSLSFLPYILKEPHILPKHS